MHWIAIAVLTYLLVACIASFLHWKLASWWLRRLKDSMHVGLLWGPIVVVSLFFFAVVGVIVSSALIAMIASEIVGEEDERELYDMPRVVGSEEEQQVKALGTGSPGYL